MSSNPENVEPSRGVRSGGNREFPTPFCGEEQAKQFLPQKQWKEGRLGRGREA